MHPSQLGFISWLQDSHPSTRRRQPMGLTFSLQVGQAWPAQQPRMRRNQGHAATIKVATGLKHWLLSLAGVHRLGPNHRPLGLKPGQPPACWSRRSPADRLPLPAPARHSSLSFGLPDARAGRQWRCCRCAQVGREATCAGRRRQMLFRKNAFARLRDWHAQGISGRAL